MFFGRALKWKDFEMTERLQWWKEKSLFFPFLFWGYEIHMPPSFTLALAWARLTLFESKTVPLPTFTTMPLRFVLWDTSWKGGGTLDGPMNKGKRGERCRKKVACEWSYAKVIGPRGFKVFLNRCEAEGLPCLHRCKMDSILPEMSWREFMTWAITSPFIPLSAVSKRFEAPIPLINKSGREQNTSPIIIVEEKGILPGNNVCTSVSCEK